MTMLAVTSATPSCSFKALRAAPNGAVGLARCVKLPRQRSRRSNCTLVHASSRSSSEESIPITVHVQQKELFTAVELPRIISQVAIQSVIKTLECLGLKVIHDTMLLLQTSDGRIVDDPKLLESVLSTISSSLRAFSDSLDAADAATSVTAPNVIYTRWLPSDDVVSQIHISDAASHIVLGNESLYTVLTIESQAAPELLLKVAECIYNSHLNVHTVEVAHQVREERYDAMLRFTLLTNECHAVKKSRAEKLVASLSAALRLESKPLAQGMENSKAD